MFVLGHEHLVRFGVLKTSTVWPYKFFKKFRSDRHKVTKRPYHQRRRIVELSSVIAFEKCGGFTPSLTGNRVQLVHPQSTFWLVQTHFDIEVWKPFCTRHYTEMASNSAEDWRSMAFRQKVLSQMYVLSQAGDNCLRKAESFFYRPRLCQQTFI